MNHRFLKLLLFAMTTSFGAVGLASEFMVVEPEQVDVSGERLEKVSELGRGFVEDGKFAGIVTMVARHGKLIHLNAEGVYGIDNDTPIDADTIFRIFSMTKPVTAVAALMLHEDGKFEMSDPVSRHLPEFKGQLLQKGDELVTPASPMTMGQLFTHTAGLTYGATLDNPVDHLYKDARLFESRDLEEFSARLSKLPLRFEPGTRYHYSVASDLLGAVVERLSGQSLDEFFHERIFEPLGMNDTFFQLPPEKAYRLASSHVWDKEGNKIVLTPEEMRRDYEKVTFYSGGGGLLSTITDYMRFCEMIRNNGSFNSQRLLLPETVQLMGSDHLTPAVRAVGVGQYPSADFYPGQSMALGFGVIIDSDITPAASSTGELSWGGLAGTQFWIDPEKEIVGIAMVQLFRSPWPLRFKFKNAMYQAVIDSAPSGSASRN